MNQKTTMTGNQAVARGFYEAGGYIATSYPGSPTVEIMETVKSICPEAYAEFSINEKVAVEVAIGGSFSGARAMASMKHVGVNVAMDPLMTFTQTKINGGFVLITGDDPGMASSQNEQDNRVLGKFANMAIFDPGNSQESLDYTKMAFKISEDYNMPVMVRITSRVCHGRGIVEIGEREVREISGFHGDIKDYGMIPPNTYAKQYVMKERIDKLREDSSQLEVNHYEPSKSGRKDVLIVTSGLAYYNLKELDLDVSTYKLGMVYPLPIDKLQTLASQYDRIIVIEEMLPFIENELKIMGIACEGKKYFSFTGELPSEAIEKGLIAAGILDKSSYEVATLTDTVNRIAMFCSGCPHRPVFDILKKAKANLIGDIGCYSLAVLDPIELSSSIISMGASLGIMKGMTKANRLAEKPQALVNVIGDGTFFHSGMTGMVNMLHQLDPKDNITIIVLNNGLTAMTGGQPTAVSGAYGGSGADMNVQIPELLKGMGFERVKVVDQFNYKEAKAVITEEIKYEGLSIVMTTRPCALNFKIKETPFYIDPNICIGCRTCIKTNCPPLLMKSYEGHEKLKSSINADMCVGCSVCSQVCPVGAIKRLEKDN